MSASEPPTNAAPAGPTPAVSAALDDGTAVGRSAATFAARVRDLVGAEAVSVSVADGDRLVTVAVAGDGVPRPGERRPTVLDPRLDRPVLSAEGDLVGCVRIVLPSDAAPPPPARQAVLDRYVEQAIAAIGNAIERARLAEATRLIRLGRRIVRQVATASSITAALDPMSELLCEAFGAVGLRMRFFEGNQPVHVYARPGRVITTSTQLHSVAYLATRRLWANGQCAILGHDQIVNSIGSPDVYADMVANDLGSELLLPIGAGETCLGSIVLLRDAGAPTWTQPEYDAALEIGRDLGQVLRRSRARDRERQLIRELSALDDYRNGLIHTVAERLQGPLDSIHQTLDRLAAEPHPAERRALHDQIAVDEIHRDAQRMVRVVDDLLLLARLAHPDHHEATRDVDLKAALRRVLDPMTAAAGRRGLTIATHLPALPVVMRGSQGDLDRMLVELLSNAVKYTPTGGRIVVRLGRFGDSVILNVADTGIGIPPEETELIFADFFRGSSPEVVAAGGSGLGLAIVERIVRRHGGQLGVSSEVGRGTTFSVALPLGLLEDDVQASA